MITRTEAIDRWLAAVIAYQESIKFVETAPDRWSLRAASRTSALLYAKERAAFLVVQASKVGAK